jgi:DnaJ-class molecular chaperone
MSDFYDLLKIDKHASHSEIKNAYRKLAVIHHPDKCKKSGTNEKFIEIKAAYEVLCNPKQRYEYDCMSSDEKTQLYDLFSNYFIKISPEYFQIIEMLAKKFYGNEDEFKKDVNNFNFKNLYNKFFSKIFNKLDDDFNTSNQEKVNNTISLNLFSISNTTNSIPIYESSVENINLNIYATVYTTIEDRYRNKYYKISVRINNTINQYVIPTKETEIIIPKRGKKLNDNIGNLIIRITCDDNKYFKQINYSDLITIRNISISQYFYGSFLKFKHIDGEMITLKFDSCVEIIPIFCIKNKGLPYYPCKNTNFYSEDDSCSTESIPIGKKICRGNLYIYLTVDGINSTHNDLVSKTYVDSVKSFLCDVFPHIN